jgi:hypothetical protein
MSAYAVSTRVNSVKNDEASLVEPMLARADRIGAHPLGRLSAPIPAPRSLLSVVLRIFARHVS